MAVRWCPQSLLDTMARRTEANTKHAIFSRTDRVGILFYGALIFVGAFVSRYGGYSGTVARIGFALTLGGGLMVWVICRKAASRETDTPVQMQDKDDA